MPESPAMQLSAGCASAGHLFIRNDHGTHDPDEAMDIDLAETCRFDAGLLKAMVR